MGYGDFAPPSWHHPKKPLTKAQLRKMQEAYKNADKVSAEVKQREREEQEKIAWETEEILKLI
jgi:hypothetical protein